MIASVGTTTKTYQGFLELNSDDVLRVRSATDRKSTYLLTEEIKWRIEELGRFLSVRYWICNSPLSKEELQEDWLKTVMGLGVSVYDTFGSETSGLLWTDQNLVVGGHDLLTELESHVGKYFYMEIDFSQSDSSEGT